MSTGGRSTPSIRGIEKPHTSASTMATLPAPLRQRHGEVGGDRGLADTALARRDQQHAGAADGIGERDRPALGVTVGGLRAGGGRRIAVQLLAERGALLVGHGGEVDATAVDTGEVRRRRSSVTRRWISLRRDSRRW